jgi:hypothetical protein
MHCVTVLLLDTVGLQVSSPVPFEFFLGPQKRDGSGSGNAWAGLTYTCTLLPGVRKVLNLVTADTVGAHWLE